MEAVGGNNFWEMLPHCVYWWTRKKVTVTACFSLWKFYFVAYVVFCHVLNNKPLGSCVMGQSDKKAPVHPVVVDEISKAFDALVESVEEGAPYGDLDALRDYIQWTLDYSEYENALAKYEEDLRNAEANIEATALSEFKATNGRLYEEVKWQWSPIWRLLITEEDILSNLQVLPWRHDGKIFYQCI